MPEKAFQGDQICVGSELVVTGRSYGRQNKPAWSTVIRHIPQAVLWFGLGHVLNIIILPGLWFSSDCGCWKAKIMFWLVMWKQSSLWKWLWIPDAFLLFSFKLLVIHKWGVTLRFQHILLTHISFLVSFNVFDVLCPYAAHCPSQGQHASLSLLTKTLIFQGYSSTQCFSTGSGPFLLFKLQLNSYLAEMMIKRASYWNEMKWNEMKYINSKIIIQCIGIR